MVFLLYEPFNEALNCISVKTSYYIYHNNMVFGWNVLLHVFWGFLGLPMIFHRYHFPVSHLSRLLSFSDFVSMVWSQLARANYTCSCLYMQSPQHFLCQTWEYTILQALYFHCETATKRITDSLTHTLTWLAWLTQSQNELLTLWSIV